MKDSLTLSSSAISRVLWRNSFICLLDYDARQQLFNRVRKTRKQKRKIFNILYILLEVLHRGVSDWWRKRLTHERWQWHTHVYVCCVFSHISTIQPTSTDSRADEQLTGIPVYIKPINTESLIQQIRSQHSDVVVYNVSIESLLLFKTDSKALILHHNKRLAIEGSESTWKTLVSVKAISAWLVQDQWLMDKKVVK